MELKQKTDACNILTENNNNPRKTVSQLFEECAAQYGEKIAVYSPSGCLSYNELNTKANRLANYLRQQGVGPNVLVALYLERSLELIIGILAIVKAGGAYLPLDIHQPTNRNITILQDSQSLRVLTNKEVSLHLAESAPELKNKLLDLEDFFQGNLGTGDHNPQPITSANDLIYVMYTSGSTGTPKGCMIPQRGVINLVKNTNYIKIIPQDCITQVANVAFDAMTFEIWGALLNGAGLFIIPKKDLLSLPAFAETLKRNPITIVLLTAAYLHLVVKNQPDAFDTLSYLLFGGEKANPEIIKILLERKKKLDPSKLTLINGYGPTEATTFATFYKAENQESINKTVPIGNSLSRTQAYILDEELRPVPSGAIGELCLGDENVGLGYLNSPEQTAAKFVKSPWNDKEKIYRTGDLVYRDPVEGIILVDRIDKQVKLRGFRVELTEIEACILKYPGVNQVFVIVENDANQGDYLVAFVSFHSTMDLDFSKFYQFLKENLPEYMLPVKIIQREDIPLNANGKIDTSVLNSRQGKDILASLSQSKPVNAIEKLIVEILEQVLSISPISTTRNFFELGIHSLMLGRINVLLNTKLGGTKKVQVLDFFTYPTVKMLSKHISSNNSNPSVNKLDKASGRASLQRKKSIIRNAHGRA